MEAATTVESFVSAVKLYPEEYSFNMYRKKEFYYARCVQSQSDDVSSEKIECMSEKCTMGYLCKVYYWYYKNFEILICKNNHNEF